MTAPEGDTLLQRVLSYHDQTKHHPQRPARSSGFMDWESQPAPFRTWAGAVRFPLPHGGEASEASFDEMLSASLPTMPVTPEQVGDFLRHALGLSAWKQHGPSRWALRVNPSSGNLHPVEAHVVLPAHEAWGGAPAVFHYDPESHVLARRCALSDHTWARLMEAAPEGSFLVGLSSISWREAWKYGERAFRYCQHDTGHALAALGLSASLQGWRAERLRAWSSEDIERLLGLDAAGCQVEGEPELGQCLLLISPHDAVRQGEAFRRPERETLDAVAGSEWQGSPLALSASTVSWDIIDAVAEATRKQGAVPGSLSCGESAAPCLEPPCEQAARSLLLQRRSAVSMVPGASLSRASFERMLGQVLPGPRVPFLTLGRPPRTHLILFVHRVVGLVPGLYALPRSEGGEELMRRELRADFVWTRPTDSRADLPLFLLTEAPCEEAAVHLSCTQDIAGDGFFSLGMLTELQGSLESEGASAYRELYWECGVIGQQLYLEAEVAGFRATGIGCFFDDPVHDLLGLKGHALQSLYHFTVGVPFDDGRLTTSPAYPQSSQGKSADSSGERDEDS